MKYRLSLDLGTNSIGWCILKLSDQNEPIEIIKMGSRIFSDSRRPKDKIPLAVERRNARGMRRNIDRKLDRKKKLLSTLIELGLMPKEIDERKKIILLNPYELRAKGIKDKLDMYELGRALMHLSKRRGFKSNRKHQSKDKEDGKIKSGIKRFKNILDGQGFSTVGEYLYNLTLQGKNTRCHLINIYNSSKGKDEQGYEIYTDRSMVLDEFNKLISKQQEYNQDILTDDVVSKIGNIIFYQRPLKEQVVGKCSLSKNEYRVSKIYNFAQEFIYLQKVRDLYIKINMSTKRRPLKDIEAEYLLKELSSKKELEYISIKRLFAKNISGIDYSEATFSHDGVSDRISGNVTNAVMSKETLFGDKWFDIGSDRQEEVIDMLLSVDNEDEQLQEYLVRDFDLTKDQASNIVFSLNELPNGYLNYGKSATKNLVNLMRYKGYNLHQAKAEAYPDAGIIEYYDYLPYYGIPLESYVAFGKGGDETVSDEPRYGKIGNPTVHVALNQLRKVVNELITRYGKPYQIVLEVGRELKNSQKEKDKIKKINNENKKERDGIKEELIKHGQSINPENILKVKLWRELNNKEHPRQCIYTGRTIGFGQLFTGEVEIEHILPFSRTLDDSVSNKTLSFQKANRDKGNKTPSEAFGKKYGEYNYDEILTRASRLPDNKKWRFAPDAMERFEKEDNGFIARQLNDMQYISRISLQYLRVILTEETKNNIWVVTGRLTGLLRRLLGLNYMLKDSNIKKSDEGESSDIKDKKDDKNLKNRKNYKNHALDAFIVGIISRSFLQKVATYSAKGYDLKNLGKNIKLWDSYKTNLQSALDNIKVSHKQEHGLQGCLHDLTAYGFVKDPNKEGGNLVTTKSVYDLLEKAPSSSEVLNKRLSSIRDRSIRDAVMQLQDDKEKIVKYFIDKGINRLRILVSNKIFIGIKNKDGKNYKSFVGSDNLCIEVYEKSDGKRGFEVIQLFDANQRGFKPKWISEYSDAKLIYRLFKKDIIKVELPDSEYENIKYFSLGMIKSSGRLYFDPIDRVDLRTSKAFNILFNKSDNFKFKHVTISPAGFVSKAKAPSVDFWNR